MTMDDDLSRIGISLPKNLLDRFDEILNYRGQVASLFRQHGWGYALTDEYAAKTSARLLRLLGEKGRRV